jgi:hypothetical protein
VAFFREDPAQVMRSAAGFHRNDAAWISPNDLDQANPARPSAEEHPPGCVDTGDAAGVLAKINSNHRNVHLYVSLTL